MKYRLFLSDFDGTLVRSDGTISERNKAAIGRYRQAGGIFVVCTGRMLSSILPRLKELGLEDGLVAAYQGATIADIRTGELIKDVAFPQEGALEIVRFLERGGHHIHVYTVSALYANRRDEMLDEYERVCGVKAFCIDERLSERIERERLRAVKILVMIEPERRFSVRDDLRKAFGEKYYFTCSSEWLVEAMPLGQNKGAAAEYLARRYDIPLGCVAAIGDQLNDLPMLEKVGGKYAVGNAEEELKENAVVVPSCDEDGVAAAIDHAMMSGDRI